AFLSNVVQYTKGEWRNMEDSIGLMIDSALRGGAAITVAASAIMLLRDGGHSLVGKFGALFALGVLNYLVCSASWFLSLPSPLFELVLTFCFVNPVLFWLFARSLFDDDFEPGVVEISVAIGLIGLGFARYIWGDHWHPQMFDVSAILMQVVSILLVGHILALALVGRQHDLMEERRRFRLVFVIGIAAYIVVVSVAEITLIEQEPPEFLRSLNVLGILLLSMFINLRIGRLRKDELLGKLVQVAEDSGLRSEAVESSSVSNEATAIHQFMTIEKPYLTEGLTIGALAQLLKLPEYRLRAAINQDLGFRNFTAFLNSYRLDDAKQILADPEQARLPILTIALDLGYGSIGPFNRAFKLETGVTPSAYRKSAAKSE
ncbi:MAG: helix-turn-helix domain-containing protein, partial [Paracoccaceae bacterium]